MKQRRLAVVLVLSLGCLVLWAGVPDLTRAWGQGPARDGVRRSEALLVLPIPLNTGGQQLVVVDADARVMGTYHVDGAGEITLKSVRNFAWDLYLEDFNGKEPSPKDIKALLEKP